MNVILSILFGAFFIGLAIYTAKNACDAMEVWSEFLKKYGPLD